MSNQPHKPYGTPEPTYSGNKRSLILAGGGMRVAYQAGAIRALLESGLCFNHADGTSGGTMNLAMLLSGLSPIEMCDRWRTLNVKDFVSFIPLEKYLKAWDLLSMGDADGIIDRVFPHLGIDISKINASQGMEGTFNVCNFTHKTNEVIPHDRLDLDLLVAGISLPIFMPPVQKGDYLYMDSVWIKDVNLMEAVRRGADELWVLWCIGNSSEYQTGIFNQYVHMMELSANGAFFEECDRINEINQRILQGETVYGHTQPIKLHLIKPAYPLPLDPDYYLGNIDGATLVDMGYADAKQYLQTMSPAGLPLQPDATRMPNNLPGMTFRERMAGGFVLNETDPIQGAAKGKAHNSSLSLQLTINICDLKRFLGDTTYTASIAGNISFADFGEHIPLKRGVFNLFAHNHNPESKYITYELAFEHGNQDYYLVGKKELHNDPGFDLWQDMTTIYTYLHQGTDENSPIIGAGILTLDVGDVAKCVSGWRITNAKSLAEKATLLAEFGSFFWGNIWETYQP
ncbi:patatin-like phospholipase family protein [Nostoc sp. TCL240-02]|uniref:patatin-like phospholipase family protein n=1 Tax=Nostoc sp. TCL240-02 TaxID=2572090 RepID=UPI00157FB4D7|nr:patatin-like phospholipase family protein [Nostoc sp. TCL240-02]QKQ73055.1 patatin-like phospholipase family protein [Nostoc sp. TCL240-02]